jgi:type II secretory pathway predicted ATPase ExeA
MEPEYDNRDAPSYLNHYGMHRPPFATQTDDEMYYSEPTRDKRLDILLHLTQYSNELLLVTGPEGSGKTTLLQQFLKKARGNWKVCSLTAQVKMDEEQLLYRICHGLNLPIESAALPNTIINVKRQLEQVLAVTRTVVIVIDDAHVLPAEVLAVLVELSKIKNLRTGAYLRFILFSEPQIKIQFAAIEMEYKLKYPVRKIDLPPFDETQTGKLIRHRTRTAGLEADNTFTDATIGKIFKQSEGIPGNIVDLAHRVLFEMTPLKRRTLPAGTDSAVILPKPPVGLIAGAVGVVLISLILMFQDEINNLYTKKGGQPKAQKRTVTSLAMPQHSDSVRHNVYSKDLLSAANEKMAAEKPSAGATFTTERNGESLLSRVNQGAWLLEQDPNYFTLQLIAGSEKSTVNHFLTRHKLPADRLAYYRSLNKGKDWNCLVYGVYPDYRSAVLALDDLPAAVRKIRPWIRQLKNIQGEIKEAAQ